MRSLAIALVLAPAVAVADDHRPAAWLFRATPGWGYAWDRDVMCPAEGMAMVGNWYIGKFVTPTLSVGGGVGMGVVGGRPPSCSLTDEGLLSISATIGPEVEWYPFDRGLHASARVGIATLDQENETTGLGVGGTLALGYDWTWHNEKRNENDRFGISLQVSALRMTGGHAPVMSALAFSIGVD